MSSISSDLSYGLALDPKTAGALAGFARRRKVLLVLRAVAAGIVFFAGTMLIVALCDYLWLLSDGVRWLLSVCGYAVTFTAMWWFGLRQLSVHDPRIVARQLESADPKLREDLLSAVELADPAAANGSEGFRKWLQHRVARRASALDIGRLLPVGLIQRWLLTGLVITLACFVMMMIPRMQFGRRIARAMLPGFAIQRASLTEVTILKPSPPSGYVAEGDAIGVTVRVSGAAVDDVTMQWRTEEGIEGESIMSPRVSSPASLSDGTLQHQDVYAANLSVGTTPVEYRIVAGDAITLWHELTPLPRPRVESFRKRYEFPSYAKLADRIEETEHGDLKALVGTMAEVTVRFDEPVSDATLRFGNRGVTFNLDSVEGSDRDFVVSIPIRTPANYQIDATSTRSGLNNPFSPQYSVTPVIDTAPVVRWSESLSRTMIVSPLEVVSLAASAIDDLPMDRVVQEFQINGDPVVQREISLAESARELNLVWDWDLLRRMDGKEPSIKLVGGDIIRTRVVGIDRNSQRGESGFIELLVAEEGFDSDRHQRMEDISEVTSELADWAMRAKQLMDEIKKVAEEGQADEFAVAKQKAAELSDEKQAIAGKIEQAVGSALNLPEAGTLELCGRALLDFDQEMNDWFASLDHVIADDHQAWVKTREKTLRDLSTASRRLSQDASRIEQYARAILAEEFTVGIVGDAMSLQRSLRPLTSEASKLPADRFPRYLTVAIGRMQAIDELIEKHEARFPESTRRHLQNWHRWSDSWSTKLRASVETPPKEEAHRALVKQFDAELQNQFNHSMVDGRLSGAVTNMLREVRKQVGATSDRVRLMAKHGDEAEKSQARAENETDSDNAARANHDAQYSLLGFNRGREQLLARLAGEESLHRSRPNVDLQYAADMKLMNRAIENVTGEGFVAYREEPAVTVHQNLATAFQIIEAKHEADLWLGELRALMLAERQLSETAIEKIKHATWLERLSAGLEWPVRSMQSAKVDWSLLERVERARYNEDLGQARTRISSRRWNGEEMLTAEIPLDALQRELTTALEALEPRVDEARETIRKYVLTLPEQAREAAEKAKEAKERTEARSDSDQSTAEELDAQQQEAEEATRETLESLVDLANTVELTDGDQRELARDADAATAQIQDALQRAETAMDEATTASDDKQRGEKLEKTAEALDELSQALEQTAEHFERAENGEDLAETRAALREAEAALEMNDELQERFDRAEAMADAAESTPEELMERLERELQQNEPMQEELSEIAERAAEAAKRTLEQAARDEASLNQSLERSDPTFQERKRRAARELADLARRAASVDQALLNAAERAVGWANTPEARPKLNEARQELRDAVQQSNEMGGENALLSRMQQTAAKMADAIEDAGEALKEVSEQSDKHQDDNIHKDDASRKRAKDQLEKFARDARAAQLRDATRVKQQWAAAESEAGRRVSQAQRQKRDAENRKRQLESRIKKDERQAEALKPQVAERERQIEDAARAEQAAKETKAFADQKEKEAQQRADQWKKQKLEQLNKPNPAAELASRVTEEASEELSDIEKDLRELAQQTEFGEELRAPEPQTQQFANQQQRIEQDVSSASEQLRRAARHEQRLGQEKLAEQLDAAADMVAEKATRAAAEATQSLQQASDNAEQSPEANRQVAEAREQISDAAQQLAQLLSANEPPQNAEPVSSEESPSQQRGEQLAQTLDELDRAIAQSQQQAQQESQQQQQPGEPQPGPPGDQQGEGEQGQQTAGEASPTLADAMNAQAQQSARQRGEQMNPNQDQGQQQGPQSDQTASSANPANQPGGGETSGAGFVETLGVDRLGSEWGQLRERRTDDVAEGRSATISPQYRREIEAYFRAIAKQGGQTSDKEQ